jgi:omega-6 fatty acid desaturase (delta-12 desaturase)
MDRLPQIIRAIPKHCFEKTDLKALSYLARDFALIAFLGAIILSLDSLFLKSVLSLILGCVLTGVFVIGHDAGHRSFSANKNLNETVGHICCSLTLWPYHVWRLSHDHHHKWTHHSINDLAWKPLTVSEFQALSTGKKIGYYFSRYFLFFWASMLFQFFMTEDAIKGRFFSSADLKMVRRSIVITALIGLSYSLGTFYLGGWHGFLFLFLIPQLVYQFWLSFFTLFHHTTDESTLMSPNSWDPAQAQLGHSIHVKYPDIIDWLTHDISWHVPHHVCASIPHYKLREAHQSLKQRYPEHVNERVMTLPYVWRIISQCHLIDQAENDPIKWEKIKLSDYLFKPATRPNAPEPTL